MNVHLHEGPLDMLKYDEPYDLAVGDVVVPPALPNDIGSGCYRVYDVFRPAGPDGREGAARACARWGD